MSFFPQWLRSNFRVKLGLFILAALLWFMVIMQRTYEYNLTIPIRVQGLKPERVLANEIPATAEVKIEAQGRKLIRLLYINQPYMELDISTIKHFYSFNLQPEMVIFTGGSEVRVLDVLTPESIEVTLGDRLTLTLPVSLQIRAKPAAGYTFAGDFEIIPLRAKLIGPRDKIIRYTSIETDSMTLINVKRNTELQLKLLTPEGYGITVQPENVKVLIRIERLGEKEIREIPVNVINIPSGREIVVDPLTVDLVISGGVSHLSVLDKSSVHAWVDFNEYDVLRGSGAPVHARLPQSLEAARISPAKVRLIVRRK